MKSIFIAYDQAHHDHIIEILNRHSCRGFTGLGIVQGRGSHRGEPHYGTHAWPSMNTSVLAIVDDAQVDPVLDALRAMDSQTKMQGSRAFVWNIEKGM